MAIILVSRGGSVGEAVTQNMAASGVIFANSVVVRDDAAGVVSTAASTGMTVTNIVGVSLDYVQGASDTFVRVIPFVPGQIWEVDTVSAVATTQIMLRHTMDNSLLVDNITNTYETNTTAIFFAYAITGSTSGSGKLLGTFLQNVPLKGGRYAAP